MCRKDALLRQTVANLIQINMLRMKFVSRYHLKCSRVSLFNEMNYPFTKYIQFYI